MTQKRYTEIPKRQKCINKEEPYIGGAKDIIDDELNKPQSQVNNEVLTEIGADNVPNSIKGRVKGLEDQVGEGGTVDERIEAAVTPKANSSDVYAKTETYSKTELNNMITTPNQEYVTVTATSQTTSVTDVLPATGEADTVYRVGNWDGSQYDNTVYSEYSWNGSAYVKLNTKSQVGEVYDISANHAGATYADLSAALGVDGANIPQSLRKGGMSVKFVQSSDKYVQYRLKAQTFSTDVDEWINVEEEIDSVKSDFNKLLSPNLFNYKDKDIVKDKYIFKIDENTGNVIWRGSNGVNESGYIKVEEGQSYYWTNGDIVTWPYGSVAFFNQNKEGVGYISNPSVIGHVIVPSGLGITYMRVAYGESYADSLVISLGKNISPYVPYNNIIEEINEINLKIDGTQWMGKIWYAYGTSITNINSEGKYPTYLAQMSMMTLVNKGISGGGIGDLGDYSHGQVREAIMNTTDGKLEADLITLEVGANDVGASTPLGTIYDTDETTLLGCLNMCIRYLQENTRAQIAIIPSPATKVLPAAANKYYEAQLLFKQCCFINKCYFIDACSNLGYGRIYNNNTYVVDVIHQSNLGGYIFAQSIWKDLKSIPTFPSSLP